MEKGGVVLLDNGGSTVKYAKRNRGTGSRTNILGSMPNCTAKINKQMQFLVGDDIDTVQDGSMLQYCRPFDRGYLNNWGCEIDIWTKIFQEKLSIPNNSYGDYSLVLTEAPFTPEPWQNDCNEVVFEHFGFNSYVRKPASWFSSYELFHSGMNAKAAGLKSCLVIDSGFSFTHAFPIVAGKCSKASCKRVNIGGKLLTNYLKELVSYRQWNMMDEFRLINQVKEELCFIADDLIASLNRNKVLIRESIMSKIAARGIAMEAKDNANSDAMDVEDTPENTQPPEDDIFDPNKPLKRRFVLPDYQNVSRGFVKDDRIADDPNEQLLVMDTERVSVPELLFRPSDIGFEFAGVSEAAYQSVRGLSMVEMGLSGSTVLLTGGSTKFRGFKQRFEREFRSFLPDIVETEVIQPENPDMFAIQGAARWLDDVYNTRQWTEHVVTRQEYLENGHHYCNSKFYEQW